MLNKKSLKFIRSISISFCLLTVLFFNQITPVSAASRKVHRFLHRTQKIHFYTASESEKSNVISNLSGVWEYEGVVFEVSTDNNTTTLPVYRFLNKQLKIHFYTASESEKNSVIANLSSIWQYEGVAFRGYRSNAANVNPVHRFLNKKLKVHFYTSSESEKNSVLLNLASEWQYEGIAYYAKSNSKPPQVGANCPVSIQNCVPCTAGEQYCRVETGKSTGYKGWACQNNNPGNIRGGTQSQFDFRNSVITAEGGEAACGQREGYMVFRDYTIGRNALKAYIKGIRNNRHSAYLPACQDGNCNLKQFFGIYAPAGDQNDPNSYANNVANNIGVNANTTTLAWIIDNKLDQFVAAIQTQEGWFTL